MVLRLPWEPGIVFHLSQSLSLYPKVRNNFLLHFLPSCRLYQTILLDLQPIFRFLEYSFLTKYTIIFHQGPFHRISFLYCLAKTIHHYCYNFVSLNILSSPSCGNPLPSVLLVRTRIDPSADSTRSVNRPYPTRIVF